ncbi:MAG: PKD domain-containing protein [Saprospiraceae bacterium]
MRNFIFSHLLVFIGIQLAQAQKHDYMWPLGLGPAYSEYRFFYDFNSLDILIRSDTFSTGGYTASYCDKDGQILFFSNGLKIFNKFGAIVENGEGLNPTVIEWQTYKSYPGGQSSSFLEKPNDPNIVYFISLDFGPHPEQKWPYMFVGQNLMATTIDIAANNGAGKVLEKNRILLTGTLMSPAACQHANGRDWWIMLSDADENRHYRVLLTPEGFSTPDTQLIGTKPNPIPYEGGNKSNQIVGNCFSSSGKFYADVNDQLGFSIFDFDRCSGHLSNERRLNYPPPPASDPKNYKNRSGSGAVFSQNDSFFYKTTTYNIGGFAPAGNFPYLIQYAMGDSNALSLVDTINVIDSADYHFPSNITWEQFLGAELGPDGRIYIVHSGLGYSTVQYPNVKGKDCKLVHDKPFYGVTIGSAIPYMPNYRLGPLDGSPCDTLGLNNIPVANFRVDDTLSFLSRYFYDLSHHEPATWFWNFGDGATSIEQSPLHQFDSAGIYQVCLTVSNQYGSDTHCRTLSLGVSATHNPIPKSPVVVSPNPFRNHLSVALGTSLRSPVFNLYNQMGRLVQTRRLTFGITEIETGTLPPGMYFWELRVQSELVKSGKCIKVAE